MVRKCVNQPQFLFTRCVVPYLNTLIFFRKMSEINAEDFVPTRSSQLRQNSVDDFQVVVHVKHQLKTSDKDISIDENKTLTFSEADMKKARFCLLYTSRCV